MFSANNDIFDPETLQKCESLYPSVGDDLSDVPSAMCEGIDIDHINHKVSYNAKHQDNVDTSLETNPTVDTGFIPGVTVWSIFTRNKVDDSDGNPLIYALKGEHKWKFRSEWDRKAILQQFNLIVDKFLAEHSYDVTVIAPTSNPLNKFIVDTITSKKPDIQYIEGVLLKLSTDDIRAQINEMDSKFKKVYRDDFLSARAILYTYLAKMDKDKNGVFTRHLIDNAKMRDTVDMTLKNNDDLITDNATKITDHDVLIVDDTISRGQTIKEAVNVIKSCYAPKSITVLTLFSKLSSAPR